MNAAVDYTYLTDNVYGDPVNPTMGFKLTWCV